MLGCSSGRRGGVPDEDGPGELVPSSWIDHVLRAPSESPLWRPQVLRTEKMVVRRAQGSGFSARLERGNSITWTDLRARTGTMSTGSGCCAARTTSTRQSRSTDGPSWNEHARHLGMLSLRRELLRG